MIKRIISGGQTGADQGGLLAGRDLGIETGGTAPKGWKTEDGPEPALAIYGLVESQEANYSARTAMNVSNSDGTAIFSTNLDSKGTILTVYWCGQLSKPYIINPTPEQLREWAEEHDIQTLNVAGNRASKDPKAFDHARYVVYNAFNV